VNADGSGLLEPVGAEPGLPRWVLPTALVGLLVVLVSMLPALLARRRLEGAASRLEEDGRRVERAIEKATRDRRALEVDELVLDKALHELLAPGAPR
jgi:hypothetical protein